MHKFLNSRFIHSKIVLESFALRFSMCVFLFFTYAIPSQAAENSSNPCSQESIQKIISNYSIFEEEGQSLVLECGQLGNIIVEYAKYLENREENDNLSIVSNYVIIEIWRNKKNIEENYKILMLFNDKYKYYADDDFFFNFAKYTYMNRNNGVFSDYLQEMTYIKILRYLSPYFGGGMADAYLKWTLNAKSFVFYAEKSYWTKYFGREICDPEDFKDVCMKKIVADVKNENLEYDEQLLLRSTCNVALIYDDRLFEFILCDHV